MKKTVVLLLILTLVLSIVGCGPKAGTGKTVNLYFGNGTLSGVNGETTTFSTDLSEQELVVAVLQKLLEGPKAMGNQAVIPEGTTLLSVKVGDTRVTADFSNHFMNTQSIVDELLARYSIMRTLSELGLGIESLNILVNGSPLLSKTTGEEVGELTLAQMVADISAENVTKEKVILYFANEEMYLSREIREVEIKATETAEAKIVAALCGGSQDKNLLPVMAPETKVISVEVKDNICYVNLSKEFNGKYTSLLEEQLKVYALVNSLTERENIDKVQILIEGAKVESLNYVMVQEPLERNENMVSR